MLLGGIKMTSEKKFICANFIPQSDNPCGFEVQGEEDFVIQAAVDHVVEEHEWIDSPQLREDIKNSLVDVVPA
jgi:predicted small metal-binding protein